eukprot:Tbor_TRINITY_DN6061_c5_g1::TRINITY_DN6061_c5_g1_i1::g.11500::m.11500/K01092/E3.1.3.25, IMPA, suhB; myo-inositol-1(or 4)-monophosphatase
MSKGVPEYGLSHEDLEHLLLLARQAAKEASDIIKLCISKRSSMPLNINNKSYSTDMVTQYDRQCESVIINIIKNGCCIFNKQRDSDGKKPVPFEYIGEETYNNNTNISNNIINPTWVIDPIDGTTSFIHGSFDCCVSIGLAINNISIIGVINIPLLSEEFWAIKGGGAYMNNRSISVNNNNTLQKSLISIHIPYNRSDKAITSVISIIRDISRLGVHGVRANGSAAMDMCSVAMGRLDIYIEVGIEVWDICAGTVIVREAGGYVGGVGNNNNNNEFDLMGRAVVCAASKELAEVAVNIANKYNYKDCILGSGKL